MKRCFVALRIHDETRRALARLQRDLDRLRQHARKVRPVAPQNLHVTVKFLGATADAQIDPLVAALQAAAAAAPSTVPTLRGLSAFPTVQRPRVLFAAVDAGHDAIVQLACQVDRACASLGFAEADRPLVPHVTLARLEQARPGGAITEWLSAAATVSFGPADGGHLVLYESILRSTGPTYRPLAELAIGG